MKHDAPLAGLFAAVSMALLAACGGGSDNQVSWNNNGTDGSALGPVTGASPTPSPAPAPTPAPSPAPAPAPTPAPAPAPTPAPAPAPTPAPAPAPAPAPSPAPAPAPTPAPAPAPAPTPAPAPAPAPSPAPAPAPTPAPAPPPTACSALALCEDFESTAAGAVPNPATWSVGGPNCFDGSGKATIDATQSHSGKQSVRIDPGSSYCGHAFIVNTKVASMGPVVYGRFHIRLAQALGDPHVTFMSMHDGIESADGSTQDLRMGGQSGILMWNRSKDDATLPSLSPTGIAASVKLPAATWTCIEFALDSAMGTMQTWVNGTAVTGLQLDVTATPDIDAAWLGSRPSWKPSVTDLKLGWESYGGNANTVWLDDIALHTSRIGCGS